MSRYWGAYDAEYDDDGYRDVKSCESCGNDCSGRLCSICRQDKQHDAPEGKSAEWEWERQKAERAKENERWFEAQQVARQEQLKAVCVENGRHWYIMGESACCVCGASKEQEKGDSNGS